MIWTAFSAGLIQDSFIKCGIVSTDPTQYHRQLRHFVVNRVFMDYGMSYLRAFDRNGVDEELEAQVELMEEDESVLLSEEEAENEEFF